MTSSVPEKKAPDIFYKYRGDSPYTELIFTSGLVRLSTAMQLNDPFECSIRSAPTDWINRQITQMKQAQLMGLFDHLHRAVHGGVPYFGLPLDQLSDFYAELRVKGWEEAYSRMRVFAENASRRKLSDPTRLLDDFDDRLNSFGIFSMAEVPHIDLMWAHYGDSHRGLCIGFGVPPGSALADPNRCIPVRYSTTLPAFDEAGFLTELRLYGDGQTEVGISMSDPTFQAAVSTKSPSWSYEREWRYVEERGGDYEWPGPIAEIVFGLRCPQERQTHYLELVEDYAAGDVEIYVIEKIPDTSALRRKHLRTIRGRGKAETLREQGQVKRLGTSRVVGAHIERLLRNGAFDEALQDLNHNLAEHPDEMHLLVQKAAALGMSGRHEQALAIYETVCKLHPEDSTAWYQRGVALTVLNRLTDAVESYRRALALDPSDASTNLNVACLLIELGQSTEALVPLKVASSQGHPRAHGIIEAYFDEDGTARE